MLRRSTLTGDARWRRPPPPWVVDEGSDVCYAESSFRSATLGAVASAPHPRARCADHGALDAPGWLLRVRWHRGRHEGLEAGHRRRLGTPHPTSLVCPTTWRALRSCGPGSAGQQPRCELVRTRGASGLRRLHDSLERAGIPARLRAGRSVAVQVSDRGVDPSELRSSSTSRDVAGGA